MLSPSDLAPTSDAALRDLLAATASIAVLGARGERHADRPAYYVPAYLQSVGYQLHPVSVHPPHPATILGCPVVQRLDELPETVDLVDIFRRAEDLPAHLDDLLRAAPRAVWFQQGIHNDQVATTLRAAGIAVVQDLCLMVEHRRLCGAAG